MARLLKGAGAAVAATAFVLGVAVQPPSSGAAQPTVILATTSLVPGQFVAVHGDGWPPNTDVQLQLCGREAVEGSADCALQSSLTISAGPSGQIDGQFLVETPPKSCPCVVLVQTLSGIYSATIPVAVAGAPVEAVTSEPPARLGVKARVVGGTSIASLFGLSARRTLVLTVTNRSDAVETYPVVSAGWGRSARDLSAISAPAVVALRPGRSVEVRLPFQLDPFSFGSYTVQGRVSGGTSASTFRVSTATVPWGVLLVAALMMQAFLLVLRNRLRARLSRTAAEPSPPDTVAEDVVPPDVVVDLTGEAMGPPVPVVHAGERAPDDAWTVTVRLAVFVHERGLTCSVERLSCPSLGFQRTRVTVWEGFAYAPWEALHDDAAWRSPAAGIADENRIEYESGGTRVDLVFIPEAPARSLRKGHVLEPGRVLGHLTLDGETIILRGETVRHQTWCASPDTPDGGLGAALAGGLSYAFTSDGSGFALNTHSSGVSGWLCRDGCAEPVVSGRRLVETRCGPYPLSVNVELRDVLGRTLEASGAARNGMATRVGHDGLVLSCLTVWESDGNRLVGESREVIPIDVWREWRTTEQPEIRVLGS